MTEAQLYDLGNRGNTVELEKAIENLIELMKRMEKWISKIEVKLMKMEKER